MRKAGNYSVLILMFLLGTAFNSTPLAAEKVEEVINPRRASGSFVVDGGAVLSPEYVQLIDGICRELQAKTTVELAVVTVGDLGGLPIEDFAVKLFRRFVIGAAGKDNGLLLLCARDDRRLRLEVGYGLEADIPDARASRLLEHSGLAYLRSGFFGRGLFLAVRDVAVAAANASGVAVTIPDPAPWPAEAPPQAPVEKKPGKTKKSWDPVGSSMKFALGLLAFAGLGLAWTMARFNSKRGKAARAKVIGSAIAPTILAWIGAVVSFFLILGFGGKFLPPFAAMLAAPGLATFAQMLTSRMLKRRLATYRLPCRACGEPMDLADESQDDKFLSVEQVAEEKAGGMDYEFWHCPKCGADESLEVKLNKASKCPQCKRRSLTSSSTTLIAATRDHSGTTRITETCLNPKCNYKNTRESITPRLSSPSPSPTGVSRPSSSSSFGGGRSGGGGVSKKF